MLLHRFGNEVQINKIIEEILELAVELNRLNCPTKDPEKLIDRIHEELADVQNVMKQARLIFDANKIDQIAEKKLHIAYELYIKGSSTENYFKDTEDSKADQCIEVSSIDNTKGREVPKGANQEIFEYMMGQHDRIMIQSEIQDLIRMSLEASGIHRAVSNFIHDHPGIINTSAFESKEQDVLAEILLVTRGEDGDYDWAGRAYFIEQRLK